MREKLDKPFTIDETACSHDRSVYRLKKMIDVLYKAGSNAIQLYILEDFN